VSRALSEQKAAWKKPELTVALMQQRSDWENWNGAWRTLTRMTADLVLDKYATAVHRAKLKGDDLTLKNFVRRREEIGEILAAPLPKRLGQAVRAVLQPV
jgi:hypothetical protein